MKFADPACLLVLLGVSCGGKDPGPVGPIPLRPWPEAWSLTPEELDPAHFWQEAGAGTWTRLPRTEDEPDGDPLAGVGYARGYRAPSANSGASIALPDELQEGLNLYVSGHAPEAVLMDSTGRVLHRWSYAYADIPGAPPSPGENLSGAWRRAVLAPDGRLFAIFEGLGLVALDSQSNLLWFHPGGEHHDLELLPDGGLLVLAREAHLMQRYHDEIPVLEDSLVWLSSEGEELRRLSLLECWEQSRFRSILESRPYHVGDITHHNTVETLDGRLADRHPAFAAGNILVSARMLDAIAVVDPAKGRVIWAEQGPWRRQHQPTITPQGTLLLFDNKGYRGHSQVLECDPLEGLEIWAWRGEPAESFDSVYCGSCQRLANGNTLVTDTCAGHAFEVNPQGAVVWDFWSPHRTADGQLVAALFELVRLPADFSPDWVTGDH